MIGIVDGAARLLGGPRMPAPLTLPPGVSVRSSRLVPALGGLLAGMKGPAAAVTLGRTILVRPDVTLTARLLHHELAHVSQWERHPVTFPMRYIAAHIRHGYRDNPFEREARSAEGDGRGEPGGAR